MKMLVVDDSGIARRNVLEDLKTHSFEEIFEAASGEEAIDLYEKHSPDLVTMDITMPGLDGLTCVTRIIDINPSARILVISALGDEDTAIEAVERGASGYVCKPYTSEELNTAFDELTNLPH
ncbi:MAG: response regulator [Verrucomicrobiota bacterium]